MSTWKQKVIDLKNAGMTYAKVGAVIGLAPSTVSDLAAGRYTSPRGDAALALAKLHAKKCGKADKNKSS